MSVAVVSPISAPSLIAAVKPPSPVASIAFAIGSATSSSRQGTSPVITAATVTEDAGDRERADQPDQHVAPRIPALGGAGDRLEADVGEENTTPAPRSTPLQPKAPKLPTFSGTKGDHRAGLR